MGTVKYTGPVASFHCPTEATIRSLKVHFSPKQLGEGTPSPENVRPIEGWDGVKVQQSGKNLINMETLRSGRYINGEWSASNTWRTTDFIPVKPGVKYTISSNNAPITLYTYQYDKNRKYIEDSSTTNSSTITTKDNCRFVVLTGTVSTVLSATRLMFNEGETFDHFELYHGSITNYEFGVLGKNKLNNDNEFWEVGSMDATGRKDSRTTRIRTKDFIPAFPNTTYTISISEGYSFAWDEFYSGTHKYYYLWQSGSKTFTTHSDINQLFFIIKKNDESDITPSILEDSCHIQLELGSTATTYESYNPNKTVYGGWVDLITGEVQEEWIYAKCNDKTLWKEMTNNTCDFYYTHSFTGRKRFDTSYQGLVSSSFLIDNTKNAYMRWVGTGSDTVGIRNKTTSYTLTDIQQMAENGDISICYKLAAPNIYHLAPTQLQTFLGQNNVWSNADYVEVEYDLHETQDILARKQFIMANQPHIEEASGSIATFNTDISAPLKECKAYFEPIQDLHGYDKPWVGGAGKNKLGFKIASNVSNGTNRIINFTKNYIRIEAQDSVSTNAIIMYSLNEDYLLSKNFSPGTYIFSIQNFETNIPNITKDKIFLYLKEQIYDEDIITLSEAYSSYIIVNYDSTIQWSVGSYMQFSLQIEEGTTVTNYEPYENICPIEGWDGININQYGKNLFNINIMANRPDVTVVGNTFTGSAKNIRYYHDGNADFVNLFIPKGTTFTTSCTTYTEANSSTSGSGFAILFQYKDGTNVRPWYTKNSNISPTYYTSTITASQDIIGYLFNWYNNPENIWHVSDFQIELGSTSTSYKSYQNQTIPITFPSEAGTVYGGYVDLIKGKLVQEWVFKTFTWGSIRNHSVNATTGLEGGNIRMSDILVQESKNTQTSYGNTTFCNICSNISYSTANVTPEHYYVYTVSAENRSNAQFSLPSTYPDELEIQLACKLLTPIEYTLTPETLKTLRGTNNIWASNGGGNVEIAYWTH